MRNSHTKWFSPKLCHLHICVSYAICVFYTIRVINTNVYLTQYVCSEGELIWVQLSWVIELLSYRTHKKWKYWVIELLSWQKYTFSENFSAKSIALGRKIVLTGHDWCEHNHFCLKLPKFTNFSWFFCLKNGPILSSEIEIITQNYFELN